MPSSMLAYALMLWAGALLVGAADGLYFHLWKFRLYARKTSRAEHLTHTVRACLLGPMLWFAFVSPHVWTLCALVAIDAGVGLSDVWLEKESRKDLGGIPRAEYLVHVISASLHSGAEALAVAFWFQGAGAAIPELVRSGALLMIASSVAVALLHVALMMRSGPSPVVGAPPAA